MGGLHLIYTPGRHIWEVYTQYTPREAYREVYTHREAYREVYTPREVREG